jgi:glycosyltransferase involved in cell wall biosynthesis
MKCVDYYVLLTKQMATYMNINKPFCVMEGISTEENVDDYPLERCKNDLKIIFYSGTLHRKFGVSNLIKAFTTISNQNYRLQICGVGDCEIEIKNMAEKDKRIEFLGRVKRDKVLQLQKNATVLVNPRQNSEEYTKYSFPSKNLEYLSSGVPLVAYKLDGIPDEYDDFIIYPVDDTEISLANEITKICNMADEDRKTLGLKAKDFVYKNKNKVTQSEKIIEFVK